MDDSQLILACQEGTTAAFAILFDKYQADIYRFSYYLAGNSDEAYEVSQETWLKVIKRINQCNPHSTVKNWLLAIAANTYRDQWRKQGRRTRILWSRFLDRQSYPSPEEKVLAQDDLENLRRCIVALPDRYRIPILLFYFEGLGLEAVAEVLSLPVGTVKSRLYYGRQRLKTMLEVSR